MSQTTNKPSAGLEQQTNSYAWVILVVVFLASVAAPLNQFKVPPLMPILMADFQLTLSQAGSLMSVFALTGLLLALPASIIIQKLGLKTAGLISTGSLVIGSTIGALATSTEILLFSRVIEGIGMGLIAITAPSIIALWFSDKKRGLAMGIWAVWSPLGSLLMYNFAPAIAEKSGWQTVWWIGTGFALTAFILYALLMRLPNLSNDGKEDAALQAKPTFKEGMNNRDLWLLTIVFGCFVFAFTAFASFLPTFLSTERGYSLVEASFIASFPTFTVLIASPLAGWVSDKLGSRKLVYTVPFVVIVVMFLFFFKLSNPQIIVVLLLSGFFVASIPTAIFSAIPEIVKRPQLLGIGMAVLVIGQNLGMAVGPIVFGSIVESSGWVAAGYSLAAVSAVGVVAGLLTRIR